jgi:(1->4)-alpha-D-glucan 1-alpha-D-glucosylmutase
VTRWRDGAARHEPPDPVTDYLFWQTLVGAWPVSLDRMRRYLQKATREAKQHTSWTDPDDAYETALRRYVQRVYADDVLMGDVADFVESRLRAPAESNVLAQKLLQLTMPGVPDVYQGQELSELTLVDPDNREPVDYGARESMLAALDRDAAVPAKLMVTARALRERRDRPGAFAASYRPLAVLGEAADHAIAFLRGDSVAVVATRLPARLAAKGGWGETRVDLPAARWVDALTGAPVQGDRLAAILRTSPVALLVRESG